MYQDKHVSLLFSNHVVCAVFICAMGHFETIETIYLSHCLIAYNDMELQSKNPDGLNKLNH